MDILHKSSQRCTLLHPKHSTISATRALLASKGVVMRKTPFWIRSHGSCALRWIACIQHKECLEADIHCIYRVTHLVHCIVDQHQHLYWFQDFTKDQQLRLPGDVPCLALLAFSLTVSLQAGAHLCSVNEGTPALCHAWLPVLGVPGCLSKRLW